MRRVALLLLMLLVTVLIYIYATYSGGSNSKKHPLQLTHTSPDDDKDVGTSATGIECVHNSRYLFSSTNSTLATKRKPPLVLFSNFPSYYELQPVEGTKAFQKCSSPCQLTLDMNKFSQADVVVFYSQIPMASTTTSIAAPDKQPGQVWVFFASESPEYSRTHLYSHDDWLGKFNWTMTYRYDSEIRHRYLTINHVSAPMSELETEIDLADMRTVFRGKTKMVAWFSSHCETASQREKYVRQLSQYIQVDIYGACGTFKCSVDQTDACNEMLVRDYKFYLAFENSMCKDYVTEKLLNILHLKRIIPVVRGGMDYSRLSLANLVINTRDFSSPKELATYLKQLAEDEESYVDRLKWSWKYEARPETLQMCDLCDHFHNAQHVSCTYNNVSAWWTDGVCFTPNDL